MRCLSVTACFATALGLLACTAPPTGGAASAQPVAAPAPAVVERVAANPGFACPRPGTQVVFDSGYQLTYGARDPADPAACAVVTAAGPQQWIYNFYIAPVADEAQIRRQFGALWPLRVGSQATVLVNSIRPLDGAAVTIRDTWRVERTATLIVDGRPRTTLVVTRAQEGVTGSRFSGRQTYWYDTETRTWLKRTIEVFRESSPEAAFEAVRVVAPR